MAGEAIVRESLSRGHEVTAHARRVEGLAHRAGLHAVPLDVEAPIPLEPCDVVVLSVRFAPGEEARLAPATTRVLDAAGRAGTRVVVIGGAGALRAPDDGTRLVADDPRFTPAQYRDLAAAGVLQLRACEEHPWDAWVYFSPPALLEPGSRTGEYRSGGSTLLVDEAGTSRISVEDFAVAVVDEVEEPSGLQHLTAAQA